MAGALVPELDRLGREVPEINLNLANLEPFHLSILDYQQFAIRQVLKRDMLSPRINSSSLEREGFIRAYGKQLRNMHLAASDYRLALELHDHLGKAEAEVAYRRAQKFQRVNQGALERAIQREVAAELVRAGITGGASPFPPVWFRMASPALVVTFSTREEIRPIASYFLQESTPISEIETFEAFTLELWNFSSLVEPTGGVATYPTTVALSLPNLQTLFEVVAHEWFHNYLTFHPLGARYLKSTSHRTLNETAATIVGEEIARRIMLRHYRDLYLTELPEGEDCAQSGVDNSMNSHSQDCQNQEFDLGFALHETRVQVDAFLAAGLVEEAESHMEEQLKLINSKGHRLRKLNQAFFAFHGTYATRPGSTSEIGSQMQDLRAMSENLGSFVKVVQRIRNENELKLAVKEAQERLEVRSDG